jgi:hypothetical protein
MAESAVRTSKATGTVETGGTKNGHVGKALSLVYCCIYRFLLVVTGAMEATVMLHDTEKKAWPVSKVVMNDIIWFVVSFLQSWIMLSPARGVEQGAKDAIRLAAIVTCINLLGEAVDISHCRAVMESNSTSVKLYWACATALAIALH